jgi:hypothetical protein
MLHTTFETGGSASWNHRRKSIHTGRNTCLPCTALIPRTSALHTCTCSIHNMYMPSYRLYRRSDSASSITLTGCQQTWTCVSCGAPACTAAVHRPGRRV